MFAEKLRKSQTCGSSHVMQYHRPSFTHANTDTNTHAPSLSFTHTHTLTHTCTHTHTLMHQPHVSRLSVSHTHTHNVNFVFNKEREHTRRVMWFIDSQQLITIWFVAHMQFITRIHTNSDGFLCISVSTSNTSLRWICDSCMFRDSYLVHDLNVVRDSFRQDRHGFVTQM